jgi:Ca2+/Na+ antiporter
MTEKLYVYGPLGIFCAILVVAVIYLYKASVENQKAAEAAIKALNEKHQAEMNTFQERYITKAESWAKQYFDLATASDATMKSWKQFVDDVTRSMKKP